MNAALDALAREFWETTLAADPLTATLVGDRRFDARMPDLTPEARAAEARALADLAARVRTVPEAGLDAEEKVTRLQLLALAQDGIDQRSTGMETWLLDPLDGPQVALLNVPAFHPIRSADEADAFVARVRAMGPYLEAHRANLVRGHAAGLSSAADPVRKVLVQLDTLLANPTAEWALATEPAAGLPESFDDAARARLHAACVRALEVEVRPRLVQLAAFVRTTALPAARSEDRAGIGALPGGRETYAKQLRIHTSLPLTAEAIHATGLAEVAKIDAELAALGARALGEADPVRLRERLRRDPALHFTTREEVEAKAVEALRRAETTVPRWFGLIPRTPCVVRAASAAMAAR